MIARTIAEHRAEWERGLTKMRHAADDQNQQEVLRQDAAFHQMILTAAELTEFLPVWQGIFCRIRDYHGQGNSKLDDLRAIAHVHEGLLKSFSSGNQKQATADLRSHLENGEFNQRPLRQWRRRAANQRGAD